MVINFRKIQYCLDRIEDCRSYYVGGSLCIDMEPFSPNVVLNRNGRGFIYGDLVPNREKKFVMPKSMHTQVLTYYKKYKGSI